MYRLSRVFAAFGLLALIGSCSTVNRSSREHYYKEQKIRHGLVPVNKTIETFDEKAAARGREIYMKHCLDCHGTNGRGDGPMAAQSATKPTDLVELVKNVPYFNFYVSLSKAQDKMPGWKNPLTEKETYDLTHYLRSFGNL